MKHLGELRTALAFFTRLPVGAVPKQSHFSNFIVYFPLVGIILGLLVGLLCGLFGMILPSLLAGFLGCFAWVYITGGLHLDGVADCGDGLFVAASKEKRLQIMKEPQVGTFGVLALFFVLGCKSFALAHLVGFMHKHESSFFVVLFLMLACAYAAMLGRSMVFIAAREQSARADGLGQTVMQELTTRHIKRILFLTVCASVLFFVLSINFTHFSYQVPLALLVALCTVYVLVRFAKKQIEGVTGDVFGFVNEGVECAVLLSLCVGI